MQNIYTEGMQAGMQPRKDHLEQQESIDADQVKFAIETVRASNPEEFDRFFPDIKALKKEIGR